MYSSNVTGFDPTEGSEKMPCIRLGKEHPPLLYSTQLGAVKEADKFLMRIAEKLAWKRGIPYSKMASFVRKRMRFDLTNTILIALHVAIEVNFLLMQLL